MSTVTATLPVSGTVYEAQTLWCDTSRWVDWVEGLEHVQEVGADWPQAGSEVRWRSGPAGRGLVSERVVSQEPLEGMTLEVKDDSIHGRQRVSFVALSEQETELTLELTYEITQRSLVTGLVDLLFIRRAMAASLRSTLGRFAAELAALAPRGG